VLGRTKAKTHAELMRMEINDSMDHLMQAATHGAAAVGESAGPRWESTKSAMAPRIGQARGLASTGWDSTRARVSPLIGAALAGAAQANQKAQLKGRKSAKELQKKVNGKQAKAESSRKGMAVGLLVAGVAAGAGAAYVARRRSRAKWDEYDASFDTRTGYDETTELSRPVGMSETTSSWQDSSVESNTRMADKAHNAADKSAGKAAKEADKAADAAARAADAAARAADERRG
jgi:hypothetical protein